MANIKASESGIFGKILYTEEQIRERAKELAKQISTDFEGEELIVIGTLKGSVLWMCDLLKELTIDTSIDFIKASSYGSSTTSSGVVKIKMDTDMNLYQNNVLIIVDIGALLLLSCSRSLRRGIQRPSRFAQCWTSHHAEQLVL